jgi:hypothetical protein
MSYCRWSSDDSQCDVYVYEDCAGGFTTHVAGRRRVFKEPLPPVVPMDEELKDEYFERYGKVNKMVDEAELVDIDLPYAGESFNDDTAGECADRLEELRGIGYIVPQYAIDALREEALESEDE